MNRYLFFQFSEYKIETSHTMGDLWILHQCSPCPLTLVRSPQQDGAGREKAKIPNTFPQKTGVLLVIFPYFLQEVFKKRHMLRSPVRDWEQNRHRRLKSQYSVRELWADAVNLASHGLGL